MASVYVYDAVAIAAGVSPIGRKRVENYNHLLCLTEEKSKR